MSTLDLIVTCPYDKTHRIRKSVLPYHLLRCRKNHPLEKMQCPFNACHVIDAAYFENHVVNCPSSGNIRREQYSFEPSRQLGVVSLETVKNLCVPIMENWIEENVAPYDPWKNTENRNIIRSLTGLSRSQKKEFKVAERQRVLNLEKRDIWDSNLRKDFKHKTPSKCINISCLINNLRKLSLEDIDTLLNSIDINKLFISENKKENIIMAKKHVPRAIETVLIQQFKRLVLCRLKK